MVLPPFTIMGQTEVYNILKKDNRWLTKKEIATNINLSDSGINHSLKRLINGGFITFKKSKNHKHAYLYKIKK